MFGFGLFETGCKSQKFFQVGSPPFSLQCTTFLNLLVPTIVVRKTGPKTLGVLGRRGGGGVWNSNRPPPSSTNDKCDQHVLGCTLAHVCCNHVCAV